MPGAPPVQDPASPAPDSGLIVAPDPLNPPSAPVSAPGPLSARGGVRMHHVEKGETFQTIARRYYGSERYAPALWQANRGILESPAQLGPDLVLAIPPLSQLDPAMVTAAAMAPAPARRNVPSTLASRSGTPRQQRGGPSTRTIEAPSRTDLAGSLAADQGPALAESSSFPAAAQAPGSLKRATPAGKSDPMVARAGLDRMPAPNPRRRAAASGPRRHLVQPGEDFSTIARTYYGSEHHAAALWWANRGTIAWPELLKGGATIIVPDLDQLPTFSTVIPAESGSRPESEPTPEPLPVSLVVPTPRADPVLDLPGRPPLEPVSLIVPHDRAEDAAADPDREGRGSRPGAPAPGGGYAVHVVRRHETLRSIARDRLGDVRRSGEIADLNRDLLGDDLRPAPGQRLLLPADASPPPAR